MSEVQALLDRLVAQFASPYDFLRELVQNSMDAGSDRVEVVLEARPTDDDDDTHVYSLELMDTGCGMDEAIVDGELTRLFASSKSDDRTMAGGYGIGFVSVFAWQPEAVLVQTGRAGEAWEVLFFPDRRFEKRAIEGPFEGTTVTLIRRGRASEGAIFAEAIRDSLWRWCRFCKLELTFEDRARGEPPELIQDSPEMAHGELAWADTAGDATIHVAFAAPPRVILLRRGLVLAEGDLELLPGLASTLGRAREHLQIWADSPGLRTTMARDKVLTEGGLGPVEARVAAAIEGLRQRLCGLTAAAAAASEPWDQARHGRYAFLHGHLERERASLGPGIGGVALLRDRAAARAISGDALAQALGGLPLLYVGAAPLPAADEALLAEARAAGYPVIAGEAHDRGWLGGFAAAIGCPLMPLSSGLARAESIEPLSAELELLRAAVEGSLRRLSRGIFAEVSLKIGRFTGGSPRALVSRELGRSGELALVLASGPPARREACTLWLDHEEPLLRAAVKAATAAPAAAVLALVLAIASSGGEVCDAEAALAAISAVTTGGGR